MESRYLLAVDIGSSSIRVTAFDEGLIEGANASAQRLSGPRLDAEAYWDDVRRLLFEVMAVLPRGAGIRGIAVSSLLAWVALDQNGSPVDDAFTWMDQRPQEMGELAAALDAALLYEKTGRRLSGEAGGLKLRHLRQNQPELYRRSRCFLSLKDFINWKLTGTLCIDRTSACYTMLYNITTGDWDDDILVALGLERALLPALAQANQVVGQTTSAVERLCGIPAGTPVAASGPDGSIGALGAGGYAPGAAVDLMGTTDVVFVTCSSPPCDPSCSLVVNPHPIDGLWLAGGPTGLSGGALDWVVRTLMDRHISFDEVDEQAAGIAPGCGGLMMVPGFTGERAPFWEPNLTGTVAGLRLDHQAAHLARAIMEGNSFGVRRLFELCRAAGIEVTDVVAIGGGTRHRAWLEVKANVLGQPLCIPPRIEATSLGCAAIALLATGATPDDLARLIGQSHRIVAHDPAQFEAYTPIYRRYLRLIRLAADFYNSVGQSPEED